MINSIAVYPGTFDPPHKIHEIICQRVVENENIEELWIVCGSVNSRKPFQSSPKCRLQMAKIAFQNLKKVKFTMENSATLTKRLHKENSKTKICKVAGSDQIRTDIANQKTKPSGLSIDEYIIVPRDGDAELQEKYKIWRGKKVEWLSVEENQLSSTKIRNLVKNGSSELSKFLNPEVATFISVNGLYQADDVDKELGEMASTVKKMIGLSFGKHRALYKDRSKPFKCVSLGHEDHRMKRQVTNEVYYLLTDDFLSLSLPFHLIPSLHSMTFIPLPDNINGKLMSFIKEVVKMMPLGRQSKRMWNQARFFTHKTPIQNRDWQRILFNTPLFPKKSKFEHQFNPNFGEMGSIPPYISEEDLNKEKSMFSATPEFAKKHGGPLTCNFLEKVPREFFMMGEKLGLYANIDVRVQRYNLKILKECDGEEAFPAVSGWHCDGELREIYFGQPDLNMVPLSFHVIGSASTMPDRVSNTMFLNEPLLARIKSATQDYTFWHQVHQQVEKMSNRTFSVMKDGKIVLFDARTLHSANPIKRSGGRIFFRISHWHRPNLGDGVLGKHEQIYITSKGTYCTEKFEEEMRKRATNGTFKLLGSVKSTYSIEELGAEQGMVNSSAKFIHKHGGVIAKNMLRAVPADYLHSLVISGLQPRFDVLIYRLYPGYTPLPPKQNGVPMPRGWKFGMHGSHSELLIQASSDKHGVSHTEVLTPNRVQIPNGKIYTISKKTPRRETPARIRGWHFLFRVYGVRKGVDSEGTLVTQQYVDPMTNSTGW